MVSTFATLLGTGWLPACKDCLKMLHCLEDVPIWMLCRGSDLLWVKEVMSSQSLLYNYFLLCVKYFY